MNALSFRFEHHKVGLTTVVHIDGFDIDGLEDGNPEAALVAADDGRARGRYLMFVLGRMGEHRYGPAFVTHALLGRTWEALSQQHGVRANTLSHAWRRLLDELGEFSELEVRDES